MDVALATIPLAYDYFPMAARAGDRPAAGPDADADDVADDDVGEGDGVRCSAPSRRVVEPALVLVHGMTSAAATFADVVRPLTSVAHVFAVDLRGHGRTAEPQTSEEDEYLAAFAISAMAGDIARFIQSVVFGEHAVARGLGSVHLLGHSWGARVVSALALNPATAPLVQSVIIEDGAIATRSLPNGQRSAADAARKVRSVAAKWQPEFATPAEAQTFCNAAMNDATDYSRKIEASPSSGDTNSGTCRLLFKPHVALAWNFHACSFDCTALWTSSTHCPLLIIAAQRGAFDSKARKRLLVDASEAMAHATNRRRRFVVVPGSGHSIHRTNPAEFVDLVTAFVGTPS